MVRRHKFNQDSLYVAGGSGVKVAAKGIAMGLQKDRRKYFRPP